MTSERDLAQLIADRVPGIARRAVQVPTKRFATVDSWDEGNNVAYVRVDGDSEMVAILNGSGHALSPGLRVVVDFYPPHGAIVSGVLTVDAWTAYTPVWSSTGTQPTLADGTLVGRYIEVGGSITFSLRLTIGASSNGGTGNYGFSLPVTPATFTTGGWAVAGFLRQAAAFYPLAGTIDSATASIFPIAYGENHLLGNPGVFFSPGNTVTMSGTYEAAA